MNYYIITHYNTTNTPYFFFVADFLCLATFIGTLATAYNHLRKVSAIQNSVISLRRDPPKISHFGLLPLSYVSWLFYVSVLVTKIVIIFSRQTLLRSLVPDDVFGPQLLKVTMTLAAIVFLLLLEGHNWSKRGTPRYSYITSTCAKTGIELLDSVALLSILIDEHPADLGGMKDFILGIAAFNFFLPALKLYQLSFPDKTIDRRSLLVSVSYYILHLILIDIPFLSIRLYLWFAYGENASMFLMKNILNIILTLRSMYPDLVNMYNEYFFTKQGATNKRVSQKKHQEEAFGEEIALADHQKGEPV
ncbi:hypothetical protein GE061_009863 [Apolygus lucorum]|uniref:Uncharacterized protein n=1 Tax=Apolygus lucorum TaxID=248454 RepID=A0A6A4IVX3_APOLU|nr:hypothetical protein GE061_009863 [Apolygus lucorum]